MTNASVYSNTFRCLFIDAAAADDDDDNDDVDDDDDVVVVEKTPQKR